MQRKLSSKLLLGAVLLMAASAALLLSDLGRRAVWTARSETRMTKRWKVYLIQYNNVLDVQESEEGVLEGLRGSDLVEGRDYETKVVNAQGDMPTVSALVDSAVTDNADLLITFSTPTLQAAIRRAPSLPIVFTYVASAVAAGAGHTEQDHLPNVTGVSTSAAYDGIMRTIRTYFPSIRRIGTLFVPAEANMVYHVDKLGEAARKAGLELIAVPVSTATEIADAATALLARDVDAVCQVPGNLTAAGFGSISMAAQRRQIPIFGFQQEQARNGALLIVARDYRDAGREAAKAAVSVIHGQAPAAIPFRNFDRTKLVINLDAARALHLSLPSALVESAQEVIENGNFRQSSR